MSTPQCYSCKFRGKVPGSVHSSCNVLTDARDRIQALTIILSGRIPNLNFADNQDTPAFHVDRHGLQHGWANWPMDFDPVWITDCKLYEKDERQ